MSILNRRTLEIMHQQDQQLYGPSGALTAIGAVRPRGVHPVPKPPPATPRENRRMRRQAERDDQLRTAVLEICDTEDIKSGPDRENLVRACTAQGLQTNEAMLIQTTVWDYIRSHPLCVTKPPPKLVDEKTYVEASVARMNSVDPQEYQRVMQAAGIETPPYRPVPSPTAAVDAFRPPAPPVPELDAETARYVEIRRNAGLPPLPTSQLLAYRPGNR